jgi:probable HAF family extracellular repeat protein
LACPTGSTSITNLPAIAGANFQVFGMNQSGQLTGFFSVLDIHPAEAFFYSNGNLTDLGTLGGSTSEGHSINALGQIVGSSHLSGDTSSHAFFLTNGGPLQDLGTLGGLSSTATAINDNGVIIGDSDVAGGGTGAFIVTNGVMASIGNLGSNYSSAAALNNNGLVVGQSGVASGGTNAFVYFNGVLSNLGTLGADYSAAFEVNDAGEIVGESAVNSTDVHGFVYMNGTMTDVGTLGGTSSSAFLVNSAGLAAGVASTTGDAELHGFVYSNATMTDLGTLGIGTISVPNAINSKGQIVGVSFIDSTNEHAFLWENGTLTDLNTLLPANSGWELIQAFYLNDAGRVVGVGNHDGVSAWFIMDLGGTANNPPIAVAGPDQTVDCAAQANLDGSGSSDPDNDPLTYEWSANGSVLGTTAKLSVSLPIGKNVVTLKVTDTCGLSSTATLTVTVVDTAPPTGSCPAPVTVAADSNCQAVVPNFASQVIASDNCTPAASLVITQDPAPGTLVGAGQHQINIKVTDSSGNSSGCSVAFAVLDATLPVITGMPAPFTLSVGSGCQAQVPNVLGSVTATDSCTPANLLGKSQNPAAGTLIGVGTYQMTITVTDGSGNSTVSTVSFNVVDKTAPSILAGLNPRTVSTDATGQGTVPNVLADLLVTDNCTSADKLVKGQSPVAGTKLLVGSFIIVVMVSDEAGNSTSANVGLNVIDATPPSIVAGLDPRTVSTDANCQGSVPNVLADLVATDNATPANQLLKSQSPGAGTQVPAGPSIIVVTVTDAAGNSTSANVGLNVVDTTAPSILAGLDPRTVSTDTNCQGTVPNVLADLLVTDNCTPANQLVMSQSPAAGTKVPTGLSVIVVNVTDAAGNTNSATIALNVADTTAPVIQSLSVSPNVLSPPNHQLVPVTVSAYVTDNCDPAPVTKIVSIATNDGYSPNDVQITGNLTALLAANKSSSGGNRVYTITVQATDASGNSSTAQVTVTVPKSNGSSGS